MIYIFLIPLNTEKVIVSLLEYAINWILYVTNTVADLQYLVIPVHTFPASSIVIVTFGLPWLCLWEKNWRFLGIIVIVLGISSGILHKTPDILLNVDNTAIKDGDDLLYSLGKKNRNSIITTWVQQNGQNKILRYQKYSSHNQRLKCSNYGCAYSTQNGQAILFADKEDILQGYNNANLIVQLNNFDYPTCNTEIVKHTDLELYGTHAIWLTCSGIVVKKSRTNRPWHY